MPAEHNAKEVDGSTGSVWGRVAALVRQLQTPVFLIAAVVIPPMVLHEVVTHPIHIDRFEVGKGLGERGFTERGVMVKLRAALFAAQKDTAAVQPWMRFSLPDHNAILDSQLPGTGVSLYQLIQLLTEFIRPPVRIGGAVVSDGQSVKVAMQIRHDDGSEEALETQPRETVDAALHEAAIQIHKALDPAAWAAYTYVYGAASEQAIDEIRYILRYGAPSNFPWAYNLWGNILYDRGDYEPAAAKYRAAAAPVETTCTRRLARLRGCGAPERGLLAMIYTNLGNVRLAQGYAQHAQEAYETSTRWDTTYADAYCGRGLVLLGMGKPGEAATQFAAAHDHDPRSPYAYAGWGDALQAQELSEAAIAKYQQALEYDGRYVRAHRGWADALRAQGRCTEAVVEYEEAVRGQPNDKDAFKGLAICFRALRAGEVFACESSGNGDQLCTVPGPRQSHPPSAEIVND